MEILNWIAASQTPRGDEQKLLGSRLRGNNKRDRHEAGKKEGRGVCTNKYLSPRPYIKSYEMNIIIKNRYNKAI